MWRKTNCIRSNFLYLIIGMNSINKDYLYTEEWGDLSSISLGKGVLYIYAHDPEYRSYFCASHLIATNPDCCFVELEIDNQDMMNVKDSKEKISLSSPTRIKAFFEYYGPKAIIIDVTGMSCRLVAPLMKCAILEGYDVQVVYIEPKDYRIPEFRKEGINQDLSECVGGVMALPGFAKVFRRSKEEPLFVAFLGFEGGRFTYVLTNQQPSYEKIRPVIGLPGYHLEYPFISYWGNRFSLRITRSWEHVEYAEANSVVDSYMVLEKIWQEHHKPYMIVAPLGTKPHAIGAILYAIKHDDRVELMYDNPFRNVHRTDGIGRIIVCDISKLYKEN